MHKQGILLILSGPSGSGKDTVLAELYKQNLGMVQSVSLTTRERRDKEVDGIDYHFVTKEHFSSLIENEELLEFAQYGNNYYGTLKSTVDNLLGEGKIAVLKIDVQGAGNIRKIYPDCVSIFITPPNMSVLESRLRKRASEDEDDVNRRLKIAYDELDRIGEYDYVVINDDLETAAEEIKTIISAEKLKVSRRNSIIREVKKYV